MPRTALQAHSHHSCATLHKSEAEAKQRAQGEQGKEGGRGNKKEETLGQNFAQGGLGSKKQREPASRDKAAKLQR